MTKRSDKARGNNAYSHNIPDSERHAKLLQRISDLTPGQRQLLQDRLQSRASSNHPENLIEHKPEPLAPLSFTQKRVWFLDRLYPGSPQYNQPNAWRIEGSLSTALLEQSLQLIADRHNVLSMHVRTKDEELFQEVTEPIKIKLSLVSLEHFPAQDREEQCRKHITESAKIPFDLTTGPLFRAHAFRLAENLHIVLVELHHIVSDGWSHNLLKKELSQCYKALRQNQTPVLPKLPVQYSDFAHHQQSRISGKQFEIHTTYWKQQLSGEITPHGLPTDLPRPALQSDRGDRVPFTFTPELSEKIHRFGKQESATPFMVLTAALNMLIYRYSGNEDIFIGTAIANRTRAEVENLIGFFANTLVLRTDLSKNPDFRELTRRVRTLAIDAYKHQDMPFEVLVAELKPERDLSRTPLFQILINYQNTPESTLELESLKVSNYETGNKTSKFDLSLQLSADQGNISGYWEYCTALFHKPTIERLSEHFQRLLEQGLTHPNNPVSTLPMLSTAELNRIKNEWNNTDSEYRDTRCVHHLFEAQVAITPGAIAVTDGNLHLTYRQLNESANQLAHHLRESGAGPDTLIGLCVQRSSDLVIAILGILKAGAGYVPLDPVYPQERLQYILQEITRERRNQSILLTQSTLLEQLSFFDGQIICLDRDKESINASPSGNPAHINTLEHTAYIIYTSGSTGTPKGVDVPHRGLVHYLQWATNCFTKEKACTAPLFTSISFDLTVLCLYTPLLSGGRLIVYPESPTNDKLAVLDVVKDNQVNLIKLTPSHLELLSTMDLMQSRIETVINGGEQLKTDLARRVTKAFGGKVNIFNSYGPTETTANCMFHHYSPDEDRRDAIPIGRPIINTRIYILDKNLQPLPAGVPGEIHIGGNGLSNGYLKQPKMTTEKFIADPFSNKAGARLYKSGDLARYLPDGKIEFMGRIDHQINLRGYRIEPGEIEAVLLTHPQVVQALVRTSQQQTDDVRLLAYLVIKEAATPPSAELHDLLVRKLPAHMIPDEFITLDAFPLTTNGKVEIRSLPTPGRSRADIAQTYIAARTPTEKSLADIWLSVLKTEQIGIDDNFFELGGHSLLASRLISLINERFNTDISLLNLFETPTIENLAVTVAEHKTTTRKDDNDPQTSNNPTPLAPLSFTQKRLWFLEQLQPGSTQYNTSRIWHIDGPLESGFLEQSLQLIASRHLILGMCVRVEDGEPYQDTYTGKPITLDLVSFEHSPVEEREQKCNREIIDVSKTPFNLTTGPLFRAKLYRLTEHEHILLIELHHIISDGWSNNLLADELSQCYNALCQGHSPSLPALPLQYSDFSRYQQIHFRGGHLDNLTAYWREQLSGDIEPHNLPVDFPRPPMQSNRGAKHCFVIDAGITKKIRTFGKQEGVTLFMVLTAALKIFISRYSGSEDIIIGTAIANRTLKEIEHLIGFFANTLVLRTDLSGNPDFREVTRRVRTMALGAYAHQDMPFEMLVSELKPERDLSRSPLFQISLVLQNTPGSKLELDKLEVSKLELENNSSKFDLTINLGEHGNHIAGHWEYCTDLFKASTIERMAEHFLVLLDRALTNPALPVNNIPLLTAVEQHRFLSEWNDTDKIYPDTRCIHQRFEAQVADTPDAIALTDGKQQLTYSELNTRANQLAHHLRGMGAGPNVMVGLLTRRSLDMVIGVMGILKAGAAYVPIDPACPQERTRYILQEITTANDGSPILLTQQALLEDLGFYRGTVICLDSDWDKIVTNPGNNPPVTSKPEHTAYVIYTSGSTGYPKGVNVPHSSLHNYLSWASDFFQQDNPPVAPLFTSISFDLTITCLYTPLLCGGHVVVYMENAHDDNLVVLDVINDNQVNFIKLTPSHLALISSMDLQHSRIESVLVGGEDLTADLARKTMQAFGGQVPLFNGYGPTEATVECMIHRFDETGDTRTSVPIGRPIPNTKIYILDHNLQPVPVGVTGELHIGGNSLANGYLNQPEMTAEKFIPDPFSNKTNACLYKSGDLARYLPDGKIEYIGRIDHQIKLRGYRIEPGEIEAALLAHPQVTQALVRTSQGQSDDVRLLAYLVVKEDAPLPNTEWRTLLARKLPDYMIPNEFIMLDAFPLTTNGKIDIKALPVPGRSRAELSQTYIAPRTPIEESLAEIWLSALETDRIGIHDNFFEMGGHSLLAGRVTALTNERFDIDITLRNLFETPTIEGIAITVTQQLIALTDFDETEFVTE